MDNIQRLEQQADYSEQYGDRISEWELFAVALICREIGKIGKMTPEQAKKFDAEKEAKKTEKAILGALTTAVLLNIKDLPKTYTSLFESVQKENESIYKYRGVPFTDIAKDKEAQKIIKAYSKTQAKELTELFGMDEHLKIKTSKAIKVIDRNGKTVALREQILKSFDDASNIIIDGKTDFYTTMRKTVLDLGGSGARVEYPNGWTRRLDTVVRQNMLYKGKIASAEYNQKIGEELGCDGIEVSFSANPRPSHRFMEGKQYAKVHGKTVNGVYYEGAEDKGVYERLYEDYNCNHRETPIILGVSEPRFTPEELARLKADNEKQFTIGDKTGDGYWWSQQMRHYEALTRNAKDKINALKAFGNSETQIADLNKKIKSYKAKYNKICYVTGIKPDLKRMSIPK